MQLSRKVLRNTIRSKVVGGIGNQLFCYFAGYSLAKDLNFNLVIDVSDIRNKRSVHNVTIESLQLPGTFMSKQEIPIFYSMKKLFLRLIRIFPKLEFFNNSYYSNVIGFDKNLSKVTRSVKLNGYFQTYKYFYKHKEKVNPIKMKTESDWYKNTLSTLQKSNFISVHVRRGDYQNLTNEYGLLGQDYYRKALKMLDDMAVHGRIVVFSDDIVKAKQLLLGILPSNTYWVDPPKTVSPVESLMLMTKASANIIANSTYSWWGAALNTKVNTVIAPAKWFRGMEDPQDIYPPDWHLVESFWET